MRGALEKMPGVNGVNITKGERLFTVSYDPAKVKVDAITEALAKAGEKVTVKS
ncbi:MAG: hypothetical protein IT458_01145 [Planctomycetes bacterium]|nr:hypothetical protein [Planctomycetota bacterium]